MFYYGLMLLSLFFLQDRDELAPFVFVDPIHSLTFEKDGADITLNWQLGPEIQAKYLIVFRGKKGMEMLPGTATSWSTTEAEYGVFTYTVLWCWTNWMVFDFVQADVEVGFLSWTPPTGSPDVDGYMLFFGPDLSAFEGPELPELSSDVGNVTSVPLSSFLENGTLVEGQTYYVAAASYYLIEQEGNPEMPESLQHLSPLTDPIGPFTVHDRRLVLQSPEKPEDLDEGP